MLWNYIMECYEEESLTDKEMREIMHDDEKAFAFWLEYANDRQFIQDVRDEIRNVRAYLKEKES